MPIIDLLHNLRNSCYRNIKWIKDRLIKHPDFALPARTALLKSNIEYELVLIDAAETPIEHPKKSKESATINKGSFIKKKREGIP